MSDEIIKEYRDFKSRMVGFPGYTPLGQKVLDKKQKTNSYMKEYYWKNRDHILELQRKSYHKRKSESIKKKEVKEGNYIDELVEKINKQLIDDNKWLIEENMRLKEDLKEIKDKHQKFMSKIENILDSVDM